MPATIAPSRPSRRFFRTTTPADRRTTKPTSAGRLAIRTEVEPAAPPPRLDRPWEVVVTEAEGELLLRLLHATNGRCSIVVDRANLPEASASLVDRGLIRVKRWSKSRKASITLGGNAVYVFSGIFKARRGRS